MKKILFTFALMVLPLFTLKAMTQDTTYMFIDYEKMPEYPGGESQWIKDRDTYMETRLKELFPEAKKVGILYCSSEANSVYQVEEIEKDLAALSIATERFSFTDTNDVASVAQKAADSSDVIYIPTDNTAASNTEIINNICLPEKVPVIAGEEGICGGCGIATLSISYYDLGYLTGQMAVKILKGEEKVSKMPIQYVTDLEKKYNKTNCDELGIVIPEGYTPIG